MNNLRIVFFGTPDFVLTVLKSIQEHFDLVAVVTTPDTIQGRKKILTPSPVKQYVLDENLAVPTFTPDKLDDEIATKLKALSPDLFVVAAYGKIIPQAILDIPTFGAINVHPSLLPLYRGPSPIQTALLDGVTESGVTLILMDKDVDHGPILAQERIPLKPDDTFASLHKVMFEKAAKMLPETIKNFTTHKITPQEQNHEKATFCDHITKEQGYFEINNPPSPAELDQMIRAFYPWPTAWTRMPTTHDKWQIVKFLPEERIQPEGKKPMSYKDFFNGYPQLREKIEKLVER